MSSYLFLAPSLVGYADEARNHFARSLGIPKAKFKVESEISKDVGFRPTLHTQTKDHHLLCIEIVEGCYREAFDEFVLDCQLRGLPAKLYVVIPPDTKLDGLKKAKGRGVGVLELCSPPALLTEAIPLSLVGVRRPNPPDFPSKYRQAVSDALSTFLNGNPAKGCHSLYDEIEDLTRRMAFRADLKQAWKKSVPNGQWAQLVWANVLDHLHDNLDARRLGLPSVDRYLIKRVMGVVQFRNDTGHKPKNTKALMKRDAELRTRFETASDLLRDLARASKSL